METEVNLEIMGSSAGVEGLLYAGLKKSPECRAKRFLFVSPRAIIPRKSSLQTYLIAIGWTSSNGWTHKYKTLDMVLVPGVKDSHVLAKSIN